MCTFDDTVFPFGSMTPNAKPTYDFLDDLSNIISNMIKLSPTPTTTSPADLPHQNITNEPSSPTNDPRSPTHAQTPTSSPPKNLLLQIMKLPPVQLINNPPPFPFPKNLILQMLTQTQFQFIPWSHVLVSRLIVPLSV